MANAAKTGLSFYDMLSKPTLSKFKNTHDLFFNADLNLVQCKQCLLCSRDVSYNSLFGISCDTYKQIVKDQPLLHTAYVGMD